MKVVDGSNVLSVKDSSMEAKYDDTTHNGHRGNNLASEISRLGVKSEVGDVVTSYLDNSSSFALKGRHSKDHEDGRILFSYENGNENWTEVWRVHKLVTL